MKSKKFTTVVALVMTFVLLALALTTSAAATFDKKGSITLTVKNPETGAPLADMAHKLYFVAKAYEQDGGVKYELVAPYNNANVSLDDLQDSYLPVHLAYFAELNSLEYIEKKADKNGVAVFENLAPGLYLIVPSESADGYTSSPFVVAVPEYDAKKECWVYSVSATPKVDGDIDDDGNDTYISVVKKWETDKEIPESITAVLLCNFKEYAKVELNKSNNWHHRWDNLPGESDWSVVEMQVPDGYTVSYDTSANTVTIINRSDKKETSTKPGGGTTTPSDGDDGKDDLIHTGQLNWPVPVFAFAGLLLFSVGWAILNLGKKETE